MKKNFDTSSFASTITLLSKKPKASNSKIRISRNRPKIGAPENNRYTASLTGLSGFYDYSIKSSKSKDLNTYSGRNIRQEATKQIAKSLLLEKKMEQERAKASSQERETQMLLDYYNNRQFIDKEVKENNQDYFKYNSDNLNLNKVKNLSNSVSNLNPMNLSDEKTLCSAMNIVDRNLSNKKLADAKECYSQLSKPQSEGKNTLENKYVEKAKEDSKQYLNISGSVDPNTFKESVNFDCGRESNTNTGQRSEMDIIRKESIPNLSKPQRNILNSIKKINRNMDKLHAHENVNWSIADMPSNYTTSLPRATNLNYKTTDYSNTKSKLFVQKSTNLGLNDSIRAKKLRQIKNKLHKHRLSVTVNQNNSAERHRNRPLYNLLSESIKTDNEGQKMSYYANLENGKKSHDVIKDDTRIRPSRNLESVKEYSVSTDSGIFKPFLQKSYSDLKNKLIKSARKSKNNPKTDVYRNTSFENYPSKPFLSDIGREDKIKRSFAKINSISAYANKSNGYTSNLSPDFQRNYKKDPNIFRKGKGIMAQFADHGAKHSFICSPFGRR
ncbi:unnamed protein product [Moneuplotes crassus]|uniref:Uncharacterized protein n=1 Tax=Euplotes crassus TaxID=5936 RepID=A0AAD1X6Z4_EUPCR|nr:unnamed protein product [Moneuplotes crassus]